MKFRPLRVAAITTAVLFALSAAAQPRPPVSQSATPPAHESIEDSVTTADALLMFVSGMGILALQLRRKQKGLRTMRLRLPSN